jgi:Trk K+ transport system NAD-binding subunit
MDNSKNKADNALKDYTNYYPGPDSHHVSANEVPWRDHIIVCELQTLGLRVAEQLVAVGLEVVAIEVRKTHNLIHQAERLNVTLIEGDARDPETLQQAGLEHAAALIVCGKNDLVNLQIILEARRLCEDLRIVANFADPQLGLELDQAVETLSVLSLPQKAGPTFADACLSSSILDFYTLGENEMAVVKARFTRPTSLAQISTKVLPLFVWHTDNLPSLSKTASDRPDDKPAWLEVPPGDQQTILPGQYVTMAGRIDDLIKLPGVELNEKEVLETLARYKHQTSTHPPRHKSNNPRLSSQVKAILHQLLNELKGPFRYALWALGLIVVFSTLLLWRFYRNNVTDTQGNVLEFSLLDALYFTITVVTSVGFGDHNFAQQDGLMKIFGILLILLGVASTSVLYAFVANFIITRRLAQTLGREQATELNDHVIVCGLGALGFEVVQSLNRQGVKVVAVDKSDQGAFNLDIQRLGIPLIFGDISQPQTLRAANVRQASTLALLTGDDLANLKAALSARAEFASLHPGDQPLHVVLRLFDLDLAERVAETFNIQTSYSASGLAAPYFVGAALEYEVISTFYLRRQPFIVARLVINPACPLTGQTVQQFYEATQMHVLAGVMGQTGHINGAVDGHIQLYPKPNTVLTSGDTVYLIGSPYEMLKVYRLNQRA